MKRSVFPCALAALAAMTFGVPAAPAASQAGPQNLVSLTKSADEIRLDQLGKRPIYVHDPSTVVPCDGQYYVYCTGRGIPSYRSKDLVTWQRGPRAISTPPAWIAQAVPGNSGLDFWAPDVIHVGNEYRMYYAVSTFGKNVSAIGLATNPTLNPDDPSFKWTDKGVVIQSGKQDDFNALDPAATRGPDGKCWLSFGSFWSGIRLIQLDLATGKRLSPVSPNILLAHYNSIEAPYIYNHRGYYYLFVNWGFCCRGVRSTYNIRVGRSRNITGPYVDKAGVDLRAGGGTPFMNDDGPFIGPGHTGIVSVGKQDYVSCHFYDATQNGASFLSIRPLTWADDGWPISQMVVPTK